MTDQPEDDGFDEIVNASTEGSNGPAELNFGTLTEAVQQIYPHLYDGILVRALVILDRIDGTGDRELMWVHDSNSQPWEALGMTQQVLHDMQAENQFAITSAIYKAIGVDDEDDEEGEQ